MHKTTIFIIQLYFINELLRLEVVKTSLPENATTAFDAQTDINSSGRCSYFNVYNGRRR